MEKQLVQIIVLSVLSVYLLLLAGHAIIDRVEKLVPIKKKLSKSKAFILYLARTLALFFSSCLLLLFLAVAVKCLNYFI